MTLKTRETLPQVETLVVELRQMIDEAKQSIASKVNLRLTKLYWSIGRRVNKEILRKERAKYGESIVASVAKQLSLHYGKGFSEKSLRRMIQFGELFPDEEIVALLLRQLSWTHFTVLIPIKDEMKRNFYAEMCRMERWNVRTLQSKINSMLYERTALSKKPELVVEAELKALRQNDQLTPDLVFRDPYVLEFLNLNDRYMERDLEDAIMRELEQFLLELGVGFCFVSRQKRMVIDNKDFHLDLLFFHRTLKRLIAIELKLGDFQPEHKGQMELYLRWLDKYERQSGESSPLGIILCSGKQKEQIELLELNQSGIHVAEYLTELPSKKMLEEKLHKAIQGAKKRLEKPESI